MAAYGYHVCFLYTLVHLKGLVQSKAARLCRWQPPNGGNHRLRVPSRGSCGDKRTPAHCGPGCGSAAVIQRQNVRRGHRDGDSIQRRQVVQASHHGVDSQSPSRAVMYRSVSKSGAMGRWTCSPKWPHGYQSQTTIPSIRRIK